MERSKYVANTSAMMLQKMKKEYQIELENDPQFYELIRGISLLHASKKYEDQFILDNAFKNIIYNLDDAFDIAPHGIIEVKSNEKIIIPKDFSFRSFDSIYKSIMPTTIHNAKILNTSMIYRYSQKFIEIKIQGNIDGKLEFFTSMQTIDGIFKSQEVIKIYDFHDKVYECKRQINGGLFDNLNCKNLTTFFIENIKSFQQLTLYIPIINTIDEINDIRINCLIVTNKFEFISSPSNDTIQLPENVTPIHIKKLIDTENNIISHKRESVDGWYITTYEDTFYTNINKQSMALMVCKNIVPDTTSCSPETSIPSAETKWIIKPTNTANYLSCSKYINSKAIELFKYLVEICKLDYEEVSVESTVLSKSYRDEFCIYEPGEIIYVKTANNNHIMWSLINKEINKYHNVKISIGSINEQTIM